MRADAPIRKIAAMRSRVVMIVTGVVAQELRGELPRRLGGPRGDERRVERLGDGHLARRRVHAFPVAEKLAAHAVHRRYVPPAGDAQAKPRLAAGEAVLAIEVREGG